MPLFLKNRQPDLEEIMDRNDCNLALLQNTYRQFSTINRFLSQWKSIYKKELKPLIKPDQSYSLLDIGFGGGDVPLNLAKWAKEDNLDVQITAIEIDERSYEYVQELPTPNNVTFRLCSSAQLAEENKSYDFVISNHVLHHLDEHATQQLIKEAQILARQKVIFSDIKRSDIGYALFNLIPEFIFRNSFIIADGLTSVKRSYTFNELKEVAPKGWDVKQKFPFRLLLMYDKTK